MAGGADGAVAVFAALFVGVAVIVLITVGPLWDEVVEFVNELPAYWDDLTNSAAFQDVVSSGAQDSVRSSLQELADGLPEAANTLLGIAGGVFGTVLSLVTLTFLSLFLSDGAADHHRLAVRVRAPGGGAALAAGAREARSARSRRR